MAGCGWWLHSYIIEPSCHTLGKRIVSMRVKVSSRTPAEGQQGTGDCLLVLQGCKQRH